MPFLSPEVFGTSRDLTRVLSPACSFHNLLSEFVTPTCIFASKPRYEVLERALILQFLLRVEFILNYTRVVLQYRLFQLTN